MQLNENTSLVAWREAWRDSPTQAKRKAEMRNNFMLMNLMKLWFGFSDHSVRDTYFYIPVHTLLYCS